MISYQGIKKIKAVEFMNIYLVFDTLQCFECTYFSDISIYNYSAIRFLDGAVGVSLLGLIRVRVVTRRQ